MLRVRGMNNSGRTQRLRHTIGNLDGVLKVDINYILDTVSIQYDANKLTQDQIRKKVDSSNNPLKQSTR
jgi:copper chaperone CopZ